MENLQKRSSTVVPTEYWHRLDDVWFEITNLMIPGLNDSDEEVEGMTAWIVENLGPDVPVHFTAFHPDWKMRDRPPTPPETLSKARQIALNHGIRYAYTGNVSDPRGQSTYCRQCGQQLIGRDGYVVSQWKLTDEGRCTSCGTPCPGVFDGAPGTWGPRRVPVRLADFAATI